MHVFFYRGRNCTQANKFIVFPPRCLFPPRSSYVVVDVVGKNGNVVVVVVEEKTKEMWWWWTKNSRNKHCFQFPLGAMTMLMQTFEGTSKEHYGMSWYFLEWSIEMLWWW